MSANDKLAAVLHPDDDMQPMGEDPGLPPYARRSGAAAVFNALAATDAAVKHAENLQAAVNDIRTYCDGKHTVGAVEIRNLLESHHV
jgi:hypothetical protein